MKQSKFNTDVSHLTYIIEEIGDYYPVFARSAQSAETLRNALRCTDRKRQFVVYERDRPAATTMGGSREESFVFVAELVSCK